MYACFNDALLRLTFSIIVSLKSAPSKIEFSKFARYKSACLKSTPNNFAPVKSEPDKSAPVKSEPDKSAFFRFAFFNITFLNCIPVKSHSDQSISN